MSGAHRIPGGLEISAEQMALHRLHAHLADAGVHGDLHEGDGVAALSLWRDLVVWCYTWPSGEVMFVWWDGRVSGTRWQFARCPADFARCPADEVDRAVREISARYAYLRALPDAAAVYAMIDPRQRCGGPV